MRKSFLSLSIIAGTALLSSGCHQDGKYQRVRERVYHLPDGSYAYHDNGFWLYLAVADSGPSPSIYRSSSSASAMPAGGWVRGAAPTGNALKSADIEEEDIVMDQNGTPVTPEEESVLSPEEVMQVPVEAPAAAPAEGQAAGESAGDSGDSGDGGGGDGGGGGGGGD